MAKARVQLTCSDCGTEFWAEKRDCYNRAEADRWVAWVSQGGRQCPECYRKEQAAKREAERAAKAAENAAGAACPLALPELQGSEKQVKWALDLRNGVLATLNKYNVKWQEFAERAVNEPELKAELDKIMQPSAKWWIDNRGQTVLGVAPIGH